MIELTATVLRDPAALLDADAERLGWLVPRLLAITVAGAAVFGLVIGSYRGEIQLVYAAVKTPFLLLIPLLVGLPAVHALYRSCDLEVSWTRMAVAGLAGAARSAVLAAALGPVLWLLYSVGIGYHFAVLVLAASLVAVGIPGLLTVRLAVPPGGRRRWLALAGSVLVLGVLTAQTGWILRPFVARPTVEVAFLRPIEADIASSLGATAQSAIGVYPGWDARGEGLLGSDDGEDR